MLKRVFMDGSNPSTAQEAQVAFLNEVLQPEALAGVTAGDVDHQPEVGPHHVVARLGVALLDAVGELSFRLGVEQRRVVDLAEVGFEGVLGGAYLAAQESGHGENPSSVKSLGGVVRSVRPSGPGGMRVCCKVGQEFRGSKFCGKKCAGTIPQGGGGREDPATSEQILNDGARGRSRRPPAAPR